MPEFHGPKSNRREFLKTTGLSLGAVLTGACARIPVPARKAHGPARWALLADTHVSLDPEEKYRGFLINDHTKKAVEQILAADVEGAVIVGDCARLEGKLYDYDMLWRILKPLRAKVPVAFSMGNHDNRVTYRQVFRLHGGKVAPVEGKHVLVIDHDGAGVRFLVLDSLLKVNETGGRLGEAQRRWLQEFLDRADPRPTFLFVHHPPTGRKGDLQDADALYDIIRPRRQVKALFYAHSHVYRYQKSEDLHLINLPAVGYNFSDDEPIGWLDARFTARGGTFTLRTVGGNEKDDGKKTSLEWRD